ncbi:hypothetical protein, partial [Duganella sp. Leaf126]|uniref:hypothetical protein n=1 Tax=Duganella sp. Leaf126 TaxID=1736266 RepID=UPI001E3524C7
AVGESGSLHCRTFKKLIEKILLLMAIICRGDYRPTRFKSGKSAIGIVCGRIGVTVRGKGLFKSVSTQLKIFWHYRH